MKRVLMASAATVLLLAGCGGAGETPSAEEASPTSAAATAESGTPAATSGGDRMAVNDDVREACRTAVTEQLAGAEFEGRGTLRAASSEGGKLYTVAGTAQADGTAHPYTCEVTVAGDEVTVGAVTVDGE